MTPTAKTYYRKLIKDIPNKEKLRPKAKQLSDECWMNLIGIANGTITFSELRPNPAERCFK